MLASITMFRRDPWSWIVVRASRDRRDNGLWKAQEGRIVAIAGFAYGALCVALVVFGVRVTIPPAYHFVVALGGVFALAFSSGSVSADPTRGAKTSLVGMVGSDSPASVIRWLRVSRLSRDRFWESQVLDIELLTMAGLFSFLVFHNYRTAPGSGGGSEALALGGALVLLVANYLVEGVLHGMLIARVEQGVCPRCAYPTDDVEPDAEGWGRCSECGLAVLAGGAFCSDRGV